jgi:hypothetical protein
MWLKVWAKVAGSWEMHHDTRQDINWDTAHEAIISMVPEGAEDYYFPLAAAKHPTREQIEALERLERYYLE